MLLRISAWLQSRVRALRRRNQIAGTAASVVAGHQPAWTTATPANPTMGGAMASFAALGDVILAEPKALIGFAGPTVIKQTINTDLPEGFQSSEFNLEHGFIDQVVDRQEMRSTLIRLLAYFCQEA